jgi:hypothetical protein
MVVKICANVCIAPHEHEAVVVSRCTAVVKTLHAAAYVSFTHHVSHPAHP